DAGRAIPDKHAQAQTFLPGLRQPLHRRQTHLHREGLSIGDDDLSAIRPLLLREIEHIRSKLLQILFDNHRLLTLMRGKAGLASTARVITRCTLKGNEYPGTPSLSTVPRAGGRAASD